MEKVRDRLARASRALDSAAVPYAVVGGNAVAAWVAQVDEAAVRNTQDVDLLLDRDSLGAATEALSQIGFIYRHVAGIDLFLDGPQAKARDALHIVFAGEKIRPEYADPAPLLSERERLDEVWVIRLESLVKMKLTSYRFKDRTHILDFIDVGLIDGSWVSRFSPALAERLQQLLDNPDG